MGQGNHSPWPFSVPSLPPSHLQCTTYAGGHGMAQTARTNKAQGPSAYMPTVHSAVHTFEHAVQLNVLVRTQREPRRRARSECGDDSDDSTRRFSPARAPLLFSLQLGTGAGLPERRPRSTYRHSWFIKPTSLSFCETCFFLDHNFVLMLNPVFSYGFIYIDISIYISDFGSM